MLDCEDLSSNPQNRKGGVWSKNTAVHSNSLESQLRHFRQCLLLLCAVLGMCSAKCHIVSKQDCYEVSSCDSLGSSHI